eukprot:GILI01003597.1.p1 GENE.GILI01003597.1~~GILI01003597.1.p1  ORF type:complete len:626 (+),score=213.81 GILI01003597.1:85-1962(+)
MKSLFIAALCAAASLAFASSPSGTYGVACNGDTLLCKVQYGSSTVGATGFFEAGYMNYVDNLATTGWDNITVTLNESTQALNLDAKYFGMGFVEGYVTYERIYQNYMNTNDGLNPYITNETASWFTNNMAYLKDFIAANPTDPYAQKTSQLLNQVRGMAAGYTAGCAANNAPTAYTAIDQTMMFYINWQAEIGDVYTAYYPNAQLSADWHSPENQHCSALVKVVPGDLYSSHVAWTSFNWMMRQYKTYQFEGQSFVTIAGHPGMIHSMDDWYMTGRGLSSTETTLIVNNNQIYVDNLKDKYTFVPSYIRCMIANYLADTTTEWLAMFARLQSGTYNNQWIVVDMKLYTGDHTNLPDGLLGVIETLPGSYFAADMTPFLRENGHWPSYNFAYFPSIQATAGYAGLEAQYGSGMTYSGYNRARIFQRDAEKVANMSSMEDMMTYNDFKNDPLSLIPNCTGAINNTCVPKFSGMLTISSRGDLNPAGTEANYGIMYKMVGQRNHAGIDLKISSWSGMMNNNGNYVARIKNGPTTSHGLPAFQFSTSPFADTSYLGLPDLWTFPIYSFSSTPFVGPNNNNNGAGSEGSIGMGTALLIISLIIIVFAIVGIIVVKMLPRRYSAGSAYTKV